MTSEAPDAVVATVAETLRTYPPFDRISRPALLRLAGAVRVRYLRPGHVLFREGDSAEAAVYLVRKGAVRLSRTVDAETVLLDDCEPGNLFGVRAHLGERAPYSATAEATEDTLVYAIGLEAFESVMAAEPALSLYLAAGFAAELPGVRDALLVHADRAQRTLSGPAVVDVPDDLDAPVTASADVVVCTPDTSVRAAAQAMQGRDVGSIVVVDADGRAVGIVTDADLRGRVVAAGLDAAAPVSSIMSAPVRTARPGATAGELMQAMVRERVHHFVVTADGAEEGPVAGIVSERDVLAAHGGHPTAVLDAFARAETADALRVARLEAERLLRRWLSQERAMPFVSTMMAAFADALSRRSVALAHAALGPAPRPYCWLALGSEGRGEQLLRTDQDNALVYADEGPDDAADAAWFLAFGERVCDLLAGAGIPRCPGEVMARNPRWNQPLGAWRSVFDEWLAAPDARALMHADIFFDLRPQVGDAALGEALLEHIGTGIPRARGFLPLFAHAAQQSPPPLSFFRGFVVERSGEHRDAFDLKLRAMMPLCDAARVARWDLGLDGVYGTAERFRAAAARLPAREGLLSEAATAYEILMRRRAIEGLRRGDGGRFVDIDQLTALERRALRAVFEVVRDVQAWLKSRHSTGLMRT